MKIDRISVPSCCGKTALAMKLGSVLSKDFLPLFISKGFTESKHFTKAGMLYIENIAIIATGTFGSNVLHITCKANNCDSNINDLEELLINME